MHRNFHPRNGSKLQFAVLLVLRQRDCHVARFRFLKVKSVKIFSATALFLLSAPFQNYLGWNYIDPWCYIYADNCNTNERVPKSMFCLLCMSLALLFLKFRFSVVKKCTQLSKCLNRFQLTSLSTIYMIIAREVQRRQRLDC